MRMTGAITASAPCSCSARTRSPACSRARVTTMRRPLSDPTAVNSPLRGLPALQSHYGTTHYQPMLRSLRASLGRFCARRAAAAQRDAPRRALAWLRLGCKVAPTFSDTYPALVHLSRALDDRWGAVEAAREASVRFPDHADAWMLLGEALQMVFRQDEALGAFEQALALEERADAAMAAGALYHRTARFPRSEE